MKDNVLADLSDFVWWTRYRDCAARPEEKSIADTWERVARCVAAIERDADAWRGRFLEILRDFRFLPGGRILAGAGTVRQVTLFNCFVMGVIDDSIEGIFEALKEGALTMQQGGGVGYDFSTLRPRGLGARTTGMVASGPVSFMRVWDAMCATILSTGARRGAMMATLRCDHPDIEEFVEAKRERDALRHFNLSVLLTDEFMQAVQNDADWPLVFPEAALMPSSPAARGSLERVWSGGTEPAACRIHKVVRARELWQRLCDSAYDSAEPGVLFVDRINAANNLGYCERLSATNPCGEEPLPPYGACNLGSLNLTAFVIAPFSAKARFDEAALHATTRVAVRFLDDVIEVSRFPLFRQHRQVRRSRRIGLGITGLADALAMLGLRYDEERARATAASVMRLVRDAAYAASADLAGKRGAFPAFDAERYLARPFVRSLPPETQAAIRNHGIRNSHLTAIAPAGTISLLANNVSSGIEPIFGIEAVRRVLDSDGTYRSFHATDRAYVAWRALQNESEQVTPPGCFIDREAIAPRDHLLMQAALQPFVDGAISKTIALAQDFPRARMAEVLESAYQLGLKGCTVYRTVTRSGVLVDRHDTADSSLEASRGAHCCEMDRESD